MKWVLNKQKGTVVNHPVVGRLQGGIAYEISEQEANMLKHIINLVIFDEVKPKEE
jgi:protein-tyrosine phosphatase